MKIKDLFENWNLTGLKIKASFLEMEWKPSDPDKASRMGSLCGTCSHALPRNHCRTKMAWNKLH